jgi:serine/threonine-protein kinase
MSPHNVFVGYDGQVKVLDFGIAKAANSSVETGTGILKGKVAYMSPEQAAGGQVDARSDVFAVGVMLWEALVGRRFWANMGDVHILAALLQRKLPDAHVGAMDHVQAELRPVIEKATAFEAAGRYQSASLLLNDFRAAVARAGITLSDRNGVGRIVQELFGQDRSRLQAAIEEAMNLHRGPTSGKFPTTPIGGPCSSNHRARRCQFALRPSCRISRLPR